MKIPSKELQTAYYQALNENIIYDGQTVPVFDVIPPDTEYPYIVLGDQTIAEDTDKTSFGTEIVFTIQVVTGFEGIYGGKSEAYEISNDVIEAIRTRSGSYLSLNGFNNYVTELDSSVILQEVTETHILFTNTIRFRHKIEETA